MDWADFWIKAMFIGIFAALVGLGIMAYKDAVAWNAYAKEHGCVEVSRKSNPPILMAMPNGNGGTIMSMIPQADTVGYQCRNGKFILR